MGSDKRIRQRQKKSRTLFENSWWIPSSSPLSPPFLPVGMLNHRQNIPFEILRCKVTTVAANAEGEGDEWRWCSLLSGKKRSMAFHAAASVRITMNLRLDCEEQRDDGKKGIRGKERRSSVFLLANCSSNRWLWLCFSLTTSSHYGQYAQWTYISNVHSKNKQERQYQEPNLDDEVSATCVSFRCPLTEIEVTF